MGDGEDVLEWLGTVTALPRKSDIGGTRGMGGKTNLKAEIMS
jgi:hypothetical protein